MCRYNVKGVGELSKIMHPMPVTKNIGHLSLMVGLGPLLPDFLCHCVWTEDVTQKYANIKWPIDIHKSYVMYTYIQTMHHKIKVT